jgi:hypothetical protein
MLYSLHSVNKYLLKSMAIPLPICMNVLFLVYHDTSSTKLCSNERCYWLASQTKIQKAVLKIIYHFKTLQQQNTQITSS